MKSPAWLGDAVGRWIHEDEDSDAEFVIGDNQGCPEVAASCLSDGEVMRIEKLNWDESGLSFETVVPSSGYRASHVMRFPSPGRCEHLLTLREIWKRMEVPPGEP